MADEGDQQQQLLLRKVHGLGDLDLAALLSLIAREHCIVGTEAGPALDSLAEELRLVARHTFDLDAAVVECTPHTTLDDLAAAILVHQHHPHHYQHHRHPSKPQTPNPRSTPNTSFVARTDSYSYFNQNTRHDASGGGYLPPRQPSPLHNLSPRPATSSSPPPPPTPGNAPPGLGHGYGAEISRARTPTQTPSPPRIANVIVAKNLDTAPKAVQIQCLELLRTRRLFTRTSVQTAPKQFLFIAVVGTDKSGEGGVTSGPNGVATRLTPHLNDFLYIAHWHDPADGFAHLEEQEDGENGAGSGGHGVEYMGVGAYNANDESDRADTPTSFESAESVIRRPSMTGNSMARGIHGLTPAPIKKQARNLTSRELDAPIDPRDTSNNNKYSNSNSNNGYADGTHQEPLFSESEIAALALASCEVAVDIDVLRYAMNVASFLRLHRAVSVSGAGTPGGTTAGVTGSVSPASTRHLEQLIRGLAALHGLPYAPPALVGLAARKVYLHRLRVIGALRAAAGGAGAAGEPPPPFEVARERSMQWGSDRAAVEALLVGVGPTEVLDDVLGMVDAPL